MKRRAIKSAARSQYVSPNRGLALLDEAIEQVELHAQAMGTAGVCDWDQQNWRCGSGMCLAGWVVQLAGGKWATKVGGEYEDYLVASAEDDPDDVVTEPSMWDGDERPPAAMIHVQERCNQLLGLDNDEGWQLYEGDNSISDIKAARNHLVKSGGLQ